MTAISSKPKQSGRRPRKNESNNKSAKPNKLRRYKKRGAKRKRNQSDTSRNEIMGIIINFANKIIYIHRAKAYFQRKKCKLTVNSAKERRSKNTHLPTSKNCKCFWISSSAEERASVFKILSNTIFSLRILFYLHWPTLSNTNTL